MSLFGSDKGAKKAADLQKSIMQKWEALETPTAGDLRYDIPEYADPVTFDPGYTKFQDTADTLLTGIQGDENAMEDQQIAMQTLEEMVTSGGLTDMDKAALNDIITQQETSGRGARDALTQEFEQRMGGVAGSGLEAVLKAIANQEAATTGSQQGMDLAAIAQARKLDAASRLGDLSGEVRGQEYDEEAKAALAGDLIAQFNTQGRNREDQLNTDIANNANLYNVGQEQAIAEANTEVARQQAAMEPDIKRELFGNEVAKLGGVGGAATNVGTAEMNKDSAKNAIMGNILSTVGQVGGAAAGFMAGGPPGAAMGAKAGSSLGGLAGDQTIQPLPAQQSGADLFQPGEDSFWSDVNLKENISEVSDDEAEQILNGLSAYKYDYKDPSMGEGQQIGPMAQELEQSPAGDRMVSEHPEGKKIDYDLNTFAALLGHMNEKINRMGG